MKNYKNIFLFVLLSLGTLLLTQCATSDDDMVDEVPPIEEEPMPTEVGDGCVQVESISSDAMGVQEFIAGPQEEGWARGIKINQEWEATIVFTFRETFFAVYLTTYWTAPFENFGDYRLGEEISIVLPYDVEPGTCYHLKDEFDDAFLTDSISCYYGVYDVDVVAVDYGLNPNANNQVEIVEVDLDQNRIKAKLQASFISDEAYPPEFPDSLRFFNVDIEAGY